MARKNRARYLAPVPGKGLDILQLPAGLDGGPSELAGSDMKPPA